MVVKGNVCGVVVFGNVSAEQIRKGTAIMETIATLKRQIADLFDEDVAEAIVSRLGNSQAELTDGELPQHEEAMLAMLASMGIIRKAQ